MQNLPPNTKESAVRQAFVAQGVQSDTITDVYIPNTKGRDFGFVRFGVGISISTG